ncbi:MAG: BatD family protein [Chthoniobacterales bacterium]
MNIAWYQNKFFTAVILLLCFVGIRNGQAQSSPIRAGLSQPTTQVGQPVQLRLELTNVGSAEIPRSVKVSGLDIRLVDVSQNIQVENFTVSKTQIYTYQVVPAHEGEYTIPAFNISVGSQKLNTQSFKLKVVPATASGTGVAQTSGGKRSQGEEIVLAQLQVSKTSCYVGETIPVTLRFCVQKGIPFKIGQFPSFGGDGFTVSRFERPGESEEEINGILYNVFTFNNSITPVKAGALTIPSAQFICIVPRGASHNNDVFAQLLGQQQGEERTIGSNSVSLNVKALPSEGRPANFNGAIGNFGIHTEASPRKVDAGEPVTLKVVLTGKGNFDALTAPTLVDSEGWKSYSPKETQTAPNANGLSKKVFEYLMVAQEDRDKTPGVDFSYFDPEKERYVTLHASGIVVQAPALNKTPTPSSGTASVSTPTPAPTPTPQHAGSSSQPNVLPIITKGGEFTSFRSPFRNVKLIVTQAVLFILWLVLIAFVIFRKISSGEKARRQILEKETEKKLSRLQEYNDQKEFYQNAVIYLRDETSLRTRKNKEEITLAEIIASRNLDADTADAIRRIFERNEEFVYGYSDRIGDITSPERSQVIVTLHKFHAAHAS